MKGSNVSRCTRKTLVALAVSAAMVGVAHADMQSARKALSANDFPAAISALDQVLQTSPGNEEARFLKGLALARSGNTDGALKVFNGLVKDDPNMAEAWNNLGVLRARSGDLPGARDALEHATQVDPQHGPAQENLGDIYVAMARDAYSRAGELEPDNTTARAKSQQLAAFLSSNKGGSQGGIASSAGAAGSNAAADSQPAPNIAANQDQRQGENQQQNQTQDDSQAPQAVTGTPQAALARWARAWSTQNSADYLAMYSDAFVPDDGESRAAWAATRRERLSAPSNIDLEFNNVAVARRGKQALVEFNQHYRSNSYEDRVRKALLMTQGVDGWQILREGEAGSVDFTIPPQSSDNSDGTSSNDSTDSQSASGSAAEPDKNRMSSSTRLSDAAAEQMTAASPDAPGTAPSRATRQAVRDALQDWAKAWSAQNIQGYLNAYSDNYRPQADESLIDWVRGRRKAVAAPAWIKIRISDVQVSLLDDSRVQASFNQTYQSSSRDERMRKRATLIREDGGWRIVRES